MINLLSTQNNQIQIHFYQPKLGLGSQPGIKTLQQLLSNQASLDEFKKI